MKFIFFFFALLWILPMVGMGYFIYWIIKRSTKPKSPEFVANEQEKMAAKVNRMKSDLASWDNYSYNDITGVMTYNYQYGMSNKLTGKVYSPDRQPIIAFDRVERGFKANGYLFASSTDFDLFFDVRVTEFTIKYNGELLGELTKTGDILDATGKVIGVYKHPPKMSVSFMGVNYRSGDSSFPLIMNGRKLATIWVSPQYSESNFYHSLDVMYNEHNFGQPLLDVEDMATPEEEKWLTALATLEIAFHGHWLIRPSNRERTFTGREFN